MFECSMETKELLVKVLTSLGRLVGAEVAAAPSIWSRALFWLYNKLEQLDWTVRFHLKPLLGEHFKNEVPSSLLAVCDLPEQVPERPSPRQQAATLLPLKTNVLLPSLRRSGAAPTCPSTAKAPVSLPGWSAALCRTPSGPP